jgi:hypothetical protein
MSSSETSDARHRARGPISARAAGIASTLTTTTQEQEAACPIGGADDPSWDGIAAGMLSNADILEFAGADH